MWLQLYEAMLITFLVAKEKNEHEYLGILLLQISFLKLGTGTRLKYSCRDKMISIGDF
jgi:hypothetical protein